MSETDGLMAYDEKGKPLSAIEYNEKKADVPLRYMLEMLVPFHPNVNGYRVNTFEHFPEIKFPSNSYYVGYVTKHDPLTGIPVETSKSIADAVRIFGKDISDFYFRSDSLNIVLRSLGSVTGTFYVSANYEPVNNQRSFGYVSNESGRV
ncbi:MAG: hypothetical protein J4473_00040 [Candidatus Aenigmarchaeota archaeon]|nr:hypothetical protein [Candidatus Aenigmarchaeota archaeon]